MTLWEFLDNFKFIGVGFQYPEIEIKATDANRDDERVYCDYWINDQKITRHMLKGLVTGIEIVGYANRVIIHINY